MHLRGAAASSTRRASTSASSQKLNMWTGAPHLEKWEKYVETVQAPEGAGEDRDGRQVRRPDRFVQEPERSARPRRRRQRVPRRDRARRFGEDRAGGHLRRDPQTPTAILVPMGFGPRGTEGKIATVRYARESRCRSSASASACRWRSIEFARHVCGLDARELDRGRIPRRRIPVIDLMTTQKGLTQKGGTMRLGAYPCVLADGLARREALRQEEDLRAPPPSLRVQQRVSRACSRRRAWCSSGLSPDGGLVEMVELADHPWFLASQFHPEFKSRPLDCHPIFRGFIRAALGASRRRLNGACRCLKELRVVKMHGAVRVGDLTIGAGRPFALIAGPCVIESRESVLRHAERDPRRGSPRRSSVRLQVLLRQGEPHLASAPTAASGMERGLEILAEARREVGVPVLTDVHVAEQAKPVAEVVDVLQTPAFLCRQTDFIIEVCRAGKPVNLKKGQFLSPVGDGSGGREGAIRRQLERPGMRAGLQLRLRQPRVGHAIAGDSPRNGCSRRLRCHPQRTAPGRHGHGVGRRASVRAGAVPRRRGGRRSMRSSWRSTRIRIARSATGPTTGRSTASSRCCVSSGRSTRW